MVLPSSPACCVSLLLLLVFLRPRRVRTARPLAGSLLASLAGGAAALARHQRGRRRRGLVIREQPPVARVGDGDVRLSPHPVVGKYRGFAAAKVGFDLGPFGIV